MIKKLLFLSIIISIFSPVVAKVDFPISDKKMAIVRKNKGLKTFLGIDYNDLDDVSYNLNLMWINKELKEEQKGIHPENDTFVETIVNWAKCNKRSTVNVWFDSELTSEKSVQATQFLLDKHANSSMGRIVLKDIRTLQKVKDNSVVFSDLRMPVYFRADLARALVLDFMIQNNPDQYSIYSDLDIPPLSKPQLFDLETRKNLKKYGMVLAAHCFHHENGFQIMSNHKPNLLAAQNTALIDVNIARAHNIINHNTAYGGDSTMLAQSVYRSYHSMFEYFYHLEGCGACVMNSDGTSYDKDKHGLEVFGLRRFDKQHYTFERGDKWCSLNEYDVIIPTKDVNYPPISNQYNKS
jgi:hypothetical protein